jgi:hypothetical protein
VKNVSVLGFHTLAICDVVLFGSKMNFHDDISGGKDKKSFIQSIFCSCNGFRIADFWMSVVRDVLG